MESAKKILPLLLVAIIFAVGGYFIGSSKLDNQGASLYKGVSSSAPVSGMAYFNEDGTCWWHFDNGKPDVEGHTELIGTTGFCMPDLKQRPKTQPVPVSSTTVKSSTTTVKPSTTIKSQ